MFTKFGQNMQSCTSFAKKILLSNLVPKSEVGFALNFLGSLVNLEIFWKHFANSLSTFEIWHVCN